MSRLTVAVISGGVSRERPVSLKSGDCVAGALDPAKYQVRRYDPKSDLPALVAEAAQIDAALVILHGRLGEDGTVQGLLDLLGIPYQCSGVLGCAMAMDKAVSKQRFITAGLAVAADMVLRRGEAPDFPQVIEKVGLPAVVKPVSEGSSFGVRVVGRPEDLQEAVATAFQMDRRVMVERFTRGREVTCGVIGNEELTPLPLVEIIPGESFGFFDYTAKYTPGATTEICPARLDPVTTKQVQAMAVLAHRALCLEGYSRSDFIVGEKGPVILESNTIPGMTATSLLPQAAAEAGMSMAALLDKLIELSLDRAARGKGARAH